MYRIFLERPEYIEFFRQPVCNLSRSLVHPNRHDRIPLYSAVLSSLAGLPHCRAYECGEDSGEKKGSLSVPCFEACSSQSYPVPPELGIQLLYLAAQGVAHGQYHPDVLLVHGCGHMGIDLSTWVPVE